MLKRYKFFQVNLNFLINISTENFPNLKRKNEEQLKYEKKLKIDSKNRQAHRGKLHTKTIKEKIEILNDWNQGKNGWTKIGLTNKCKIPRIIRIFLKKLLNF